MEDSELALRRYRLERVLAAQRLVEIAAKEGWLRSIGREDLADGIAKRRVEAQSVLCVLDELVA